MQASKFELVNRQNTWSHLAPNPSRKRRRCDRVASNLLHRICRLMARSEHAASRRLRLLSKEDRTLGGRRLWAVFGTKT
jgi:hypothetical protein